MTTLTDIVAETNVLTNDSTDTVTNKTITSAANTLSLSAVDLTSGTVPTARLGSGAASSSTFLRGDNTWASAGGTLLAESENTSSPNATQPVNALTAISSATNADVAIIPKGFGALLVKVPNNASNGGNKRGNYAVDLQLWNGAATYVASGAYSGIFAGSNNTADADYAVSVGGLNNQAGGQYSITLAGYGGDSLSTYGVTQGYFSANATGTSGIACGTLVDNYGSYSATFGYYTQSTRNTSLTVGTYGRGGTTTYPAAASMQSMHCRTTDATVTRCSSGGTGSGDTYEVRMPIQSGHLVRFLVTAQAPGGGDTKAWELVACLKRGSSGVPSIVGSVSKTVIAADTGASSWDVDVVVGTTEGYSVEVTGAAATTINWSVAAFLSEART